MLTRFVRIQLLIFTIIGIVGVIAMALFYIQAPTLLGIGRMTVTLELPATGGLYRFSNVTYRGVQVGKVTAVSLTANGAKATLSLGTSPKIPANLQADVLSVSAVGEQYVDLRPRTDSAPYLHNGSVIAMHDTTIPQAVGPMLDQVNALVKSLPKNKIGQLLDESFQAFNGAGYDLGSLSDSASRISADSNSIVDRTRALTEDSQPLLDAQAQTTDSIRQWAHSLAGISDVLANDDSRVRTVLENGPGALDEASRLFQQIKPTLPVLLANLTTIGQIGITYHPSIEQLLVLLPAAVAYEQTAGSLNWPDGQSRGDFALTIDDPPICTVGFLPQSQWRSPADTSDIDTPGRDVLQTAAGFTACGSRRPQLSVHGSSRKARAHRRNLQQRQAVHAVGDAPACARPVPPGSQLACPGHTARRPGHRRQENLRPDRGNTAAAGGRPARNTRGAAGSNSTTGHAGRGRTAGAVVGGQHVDSGGGFSVDSATRRSRRRLPCTGRLRLRSHRP